MENTMDKEKLRRRRNRAVSIELNLDAGDRLIEMVSRPNGLFLISLNKILRQRSPDDLDPELEHTDAPWEQSIFLPRGTTDPLVARCIIQTIRLTEMFFPKNSDHFRAISDISWEVLSSLISLRVIRERLETKINEIIKIVSDDLDAYTKGDCPKPLPIVEYYDIEFRSFVNEVKRCLDIISELFPAISGIKFGKETFYRGHFHKAQEWAVKNYGQDSVLAQMLAGDQRWIKPWIEIRNAIEHPSHGKFIETLNFSLEPNRTIRLPTWRLIHPDFDMARPQNLLEVSDLCINNLLKFFEDLLVSLLDGHLPSRIKIILETIPEELRDKNLPVRYRATPVIEKQCHAISHFEEKK